ncbi:MAG: hypothetical protein AAF921_16440 [Cyanobacteria bacterium P01_D01_bin.44]
MHKPSMSYQSGRAHVDSPVLGQPARRRKQQRPAALHNAKLRKARMLQRLGRHPWATHRPLRWI